MDTQDGTSITADSAGAKPNTRSDSSHRHWLIYACLATSYLLLLYFASRHVVQQGRFGIALFTFVVALPIMVNGAYHAAVSRILFLQGLRTQGKIFRFYSGYVVRLLTHTVLGLFAAIAMVVEVIYSATPHFYVWSTLAIVMLILYPIYSKVSITAGAEVQGWNKDRISLLVATVLVAFVATIFYSIATNFIAEVPIFESIDAAVSAQPQFDTHERSIALLFDYYNQARGTAQYTLAHLRTTFAGRIVYVIVYETMVFFFFAGITSAMATFCVPLRELKRVVSRPTTDSEPAVSKLYVVLTVAIVLSVGVCYAYGFRGFTMEVERVHDQYVQVGTVSLLERTRALHEGVLRAQLQDVATLTSDDMEAVVDIMFTDMRSNVDGFLDWYYGVGGEVFRTTQRALGALTRNSDRLEEQTLDRLHEKLMEDVSIATYRTHWESFQRVADTLVRVTEQQYNIERDKIVRSTSVDMKTTVGPTTVVRDADSFEFDIADDLRSRFATQHEAFLQRQNTSIVAGAITGAVASAVVGKAVFGSGIRGIDRLLAKAPRVVRPLIKTTLLSSKLVAVSGAGALVMVAMTVGSEYVLLKFREVRERPQFRTVIMEAIDVSQRDLVTEIQHLLDY